MTTARLDARAKAARQPARIPGWTNAFFHDDTPSGGGFHGLQVGRDHGYRNADINVNACKTSLAKRLLGLIGVFICTHWITTGHDHWTSINTKGSVRFASLTWAQVKRLRSPGGSGSAGSGR